MESYHYAIKLKAQAEKKVVWGTFVPKITFVLYLCNAIKEYIDTEIIADQASRTYPDTFLTKIGKKKIPDTYIIVMALKEAKSDKWHYARGDVVKGWRLTQQGIQFAKDVERRTKKKNKI